MKNLIYYLFTVLLITVSCQSKKDNRENKSEFDQQASKIQDELRATAPNLPPPDEFAARLQATGADFFEDVINDPINADQYINQAENKAAANIGVYFADLAYTSAYGQTEHSFKLLEAMMKLSTRLGVESNMVNTIMKRYNDYVEIPDSVRLYLQEYGDKTTETLMDMGREQLSAAMYTGFYFEGLHIALKIIENYPDDLPEEARMTILIPAYMAILDEKENVSKVQDFVEKYVEGENVGYFLEAMSDLVDIYETLDVREKIKNNKLMELKGDPNLQKLSDKITEIRAKIVE